MSIPGKYLYGFAEGDIQLPADLLGLANAPVQAVRLREIAALISDHAVEKLPLLRRHVEPYHRVIREVSSRATFIPASFGHISDNEGQILAVLQENYAGIREELLRLRGKAEMGVKLMWDVDNIFDYIVGIDRELQSRRDRVFGKSRPSMEERLELGALFEKRLRLERERLGNQVIDALRSVTCDLRVNTPTDEKAVLQAAFLIERAREKEFEATLYRAAGLFDSNYALDYNGPWPPYSFVRLTLNLTDATVGAGV